MGSSSKIKEFGRNGSLVFAQKVAGNGGQIQFDAPIKVSGGLEGALALPKGKLWFVDSGKGSDGNDGSSWTKAFKTFAKAIANAKDWDVVFLAGGDYAENDISVTQRGLKILGVNTVGATRGPVLFIGSGTFILQLRNHDIEIAGCGFYQTTAYPCVQAAILSEHIWRTHIHDCGFSGGGTGELGISMGEVAAEAPYTMVEDCRFYNLSTTSVRLNSSAMVVRNNIFQLKASAIGIEVVPTTSSRPDKWIYGNKFVSIDVVNAVGIKVTNTPNVGELFVDSNHFVNFADNDHCISKRTGYTGLNYLGVTAIPIT